MIISRGRRYIFVHAPKTGGTSLALALEARAMADDMMLGDTPKAKKRRRRLKGMTASGRLWKHSRLRDIYGLVDQTEIDGFFVVTLVRNPWDRLVSYYHWFRAQSFDNPVVGLAKELNFSAFLNHPRTISGFRASTYSSYVTDATGQERCDLFLRLEHLAEDITPFEMHLGFSLGVIPHENKSARAADHRSYYSDADRDMVARVSAPDIARFGYEF